MQKPMLNFWQIWNMCFGFLGIQFGFALQNANVSRIFQTLGANIDDIPILWIAAPVTGLIVQPIVGYFSDHTWNKLGRRRPYFLWGAMLASTALIFMPNSPSLWIAAGLLWVLDASINVSMEPFRALVGDMLPEKQRTTGFAVQSFFIGTGAVVASALPWILTQGFGIDNTAAPGEIPLTVKYAFYLGSIVLFLAVGWTIIRTREYSPKQLQEFSQNSDASLETNIHRQTSKEEKNDTIAHNRDGFIAFILGILITIVVNHYSLDKQLYILTAGMIIFAALHWSMAWMKKERKINNNYFHIIENLFCMPRVMKQLAIVQFFSWFALFSMWIYTTAGVTAFHYHTEDASSKLYNDGADWVGILFAAYNGFAALAAIFIPIMAKRIGRRKTHLLNLSLGGIGLISFIFIHNPSWLLLSMVGVGFAWASILSVPYALLANVLPAEKMGVFMGIFNFFIVIPQILAATILGFLVKYLFSDQAIYALVMGGVFMIISGLLTLRIKT